MQTLDSPSTCQKTPILERAGVHRAAPRSLRHRPPAVRASLSSVLLKNNETELAPGGLDGRDFVASNFALIESAIGFVCRQKRLSRDEGEDLSSIVYLKLLENGSTVLRQFRGESSLRTFLIVVVQRTLIDARIAKWGKWRPSTRARRLGVVAVNLERLIFRDGLCLLEAAQVLRAKFANADTDDELHFLLSLLPQRSRRRFVGADDALRHMPARDAGPDQALSCLPAVLTLETLERVLASLDPGDRELIRLRFEKGLRMCLIARLQGIDGRAIYRRFEALLKRLRTQLQHQGISAVDVRAWLCSPQNGSQC